MGTVFWIVIAYSVTGWLLFRSVARAAAWGIMRNREEAEVSQNKLLLAAALLVVGAILSGPMTWGNAVRFWISQREQSLQE